MFFCTVLLQVAPAKITGLDVNAYSATEKEKGLCNSCSLGIAEFNKVRFFYVVTLRSSDMQMSTSGAVGSGC